MEGILVPISLFLGAFAMVFGIRYLSNKEKMAMIERGLNPGVGKSAPKPYLSLKFGLLLVGLGIGLLVALFTVRGLFGSDMTNNEEGQSVAIYFGCLGIFGGLGLITSFVIEKKAIEKDKF
ncbi:MULTISPECIES: DUF6249 domain-containing protein [Pedobacter]|uniref:Tetrahydromethanopterin S-methyltransferase subunit E n=1 Tax=Pedobacter zeae TaxID=1737356 RepID=A0A7W6KD67_9SPHI|nr:DUF6249 domain-containing protein [Pedobacter zeae]MBB4109437.1 tetrahydromethanopterin S-methyltransferase subunit E [Pedobacter zeae]GGH12215.1 hypothetical protein GCM10007422_31990 [Pedobacter zeae]